VLDVGDEGAVALAGLTGLGVEVELRHEEQRQTLGARAGALGAGQDQVHDVFEQVVRVGRGDESLHTVDVPGAVGLLGGLGAAGAHVRAGVGLGQHHGGAPAALGSEDGPLLLLIGAVVVEDFAHARAHGVHVGGRVGAEDVLDERPLQRAGHRHAAELLFEADLVPAAVEQSAHRLLEGRGQGDGVGRGVEDRRVAVAVGERIGDRALGEARDLVEHFSGSVGVQVGELAVTQSLVYAEDLEQVEHLVTDVALVVAHDFSSMRWTVGLGTQG
jgi:hypothetical protein